MRVKGKKEGLLSDQREAIIQKRQMGGETAESDVL
jgi:hypothetical protein